MSDFSGEQVAEATLDDDYTKPRGWRHTATWTYLVMLIASAAVVTAYAITVAQVPLQIAQGLSSLTDNPTLM